MILQVKYEDAIRYYREAFKLEPNSEYTANKLAWYLATINDAKVRNGNEAVKIAKLACKITNYSDPITLDTLATAYAESGRFKEAIKMAQKALDLAQSEGEEDLAKEIQNRLQLFKKNKPFHSLPLAKKHL